MKKTQILCVKALLFSLVLLANLFHLQAFTFNMYSGRGSSALVSVIDKDNRVLHQSNLFHKKSDKGILFLSSWIASDFCKISGATAIVLGQKNFKPHEC